MKKQFLLWLKAGKPVLLGFKTRPKMPPWRVQLGLILLGVCTFFAIDGLAFSGEVRDNPLYFQTKMVKIVDNGSERTVMTRANTIEGVLNEQKISVDSADWMDYSKFDEIKEKYLEINIHRARPVVINDQGVERYILTAETTPEGIARYAGLTMYKNDTAKVEAIGDILLEGGAGLEMTITRREAVMEIEENEAIPYETKQEFDGSKPPKFKEITTPGEIGNRRVRYQITVKAGKEIARVMLSSTITKEPKVQIEKVGPAYAGVKTSPSENQKIIWQYLLAQGFARHQVAGIMGNLQAEHGYQTSGDGLAQWTGGRKARLMAMSDPYSVYTQLEFLMIELNGGYLGAKNAILASTTVEDAVLAFQDRYERCGRCNTPRRMQFAYNVLASF